MTVRLQLSAPLPIVMAVLAACAGSRGTDSSSASAPAPIRDGRYAFSERPSGTSITLEGTFVVLGDTVMVDATPGPCRYDSNNAPGSPIAYRCADVSLWFDRRDPVTKATYDFQSVESKPKSVCVRYTTGPNGQQVCAQTGIEMVEVKVEHSGTLHAHLSAKP
jgi:hypothetical protein